MAKLMVKRRKPQEGRWKRVEGLGKGGRLDVRSWHKTRSSLRTEPELAGTITEQVTSDLRRANALMRVWERG
jgi:hypothetical protein